ncbi:citrate (Si)-synthase [Candidatus Protochlamydia phocaeensis]|uniref:citrate (Si)-synthase n=1 Tax=Candidatus Protochlamydia phocaeensis TaxID=1414722 RepID=UPI000838BDEC|nr:citrate (Si)-synthase [Candidatus Protochlamydia phocaeensis]
MSEVLFEVTKDNLETGMRGYPVGYCTTSTVDPQKGLFYSGIPVSELDHWQPEQVIYLLYHGKKGEPEEIAKFSDDLRKRAVCSPELIKHIQQLPRRGHPMKLFNAAILLAGCFEGKNHYREDCLNLIAKIPEIAAAVINHHAGWGPSKSSKPELGYMENFAHMLNVPKANQEELTRAFKLFNILHYDHGGGNLSAFVGKAIASGLEDMYGSIAGAMCALAGPRHGKANQDCLLFVKGLLEELGENATEGQVEDAIRQKLKNNELVFGFGHAVLRVEDPRATLLYQVIARYYPQHPLVKMANLLRKAGTKVLKENPKISDPYPNVDAVSGILLTASGFPYPDYYTILFGLARTVGISRQIVYEREEARDGKGTPIVRPKYLFKPQKDVMPI